MRLFAPHWAKLAVDGGVPIRTEPCPQWPIYDADEIGTVVAILESGKVNQWTGSTVKTFQEEFAARHGRRHGVAVSNGSVALEIALRAFQIGPGDEVIVPARSFVASAACASIVGATPIFADVDLGSEVVVPSTIEPLIGERTRAIIPVHLNGRPCDMPRIMELALRHDLRVIEDCAQSLGARIDGRLLGSFGHAAAFSFCQDKIISTGGEGGMIVLDDEDAWNVAWSFKDHGKSFEKAFDRLHDPGYRWVHESIGSNARMTEVQAAIGRVQLNKLDNWIAKRNANANRLAQALSAYPFVALPTVPPNHVHARYRLEFSVEETRMHSGWSRGRLLDALNSEGIAAYAGCCPEIYREGAFARQRSYPSLPNAERLGRTSLVLLTHPTLDERYLADCESAIDKVFGAASL
jgi:dTDP-4-amino-4,6-dideoxygalactose transaminase